MGVELTEVINPLKYLYSLPRAKRQE